MCGRWPVSVPACTIVGRPIAPAGSPSKGGGNCAGCWCTWVAVNTHPHWKEQYQRLTRRKPTNKAIVATARKLLVVVWHVLTEREADRRADLDMVAFRLMLWSWQLGKERRGGLPTPQFVRAGLRRLEVRPHPHRPWRHGAPDRAGGTSVGPGSTNLANRPSTAAQPATTGQFTCTPIRKQLGRQGGEDIVCLRPHAIEMLFWQILRLQYLTNQFIGMRMQSIRGMPRQEDSGSIKVTRLWSPILGSHIPPGRQRNEPQWPRADHIACIAIP
jgi:hypothetical protein